MEKIKRLKEEIIELFESRFACNHSSKLGCVFIFIIAANHNINTEIRASVIIKPEEISISLELHEDLSMKRVFYNTLFRTMNKEQLNKLKKVLDHADIILNLCICHMLIFPAIKTPTILFRYPEIIVQNVQINHSYSINHKITFNIKEDIVKADLYPYSFNSCDFFKIINMVKPNRYTETRNAEVIDYLNSLRGAMTEYVKS